MFDLLDDTRIHPLQYGAAIEVAYEAIGKVGEPDAAVDRLCSRRRDVEKVNLEVCEAFQLHLKAADALSIITAHRRTACVL